MTIGPETNAPRRQALRCDASKVQAFQRDLPLDKSSTLVFYCSNVMCRKAPTAARRAKRLGYHNVHVMSAGISGWLHAVLPTESGERSG